MVQVFAEKLQGIHRAPLEAAIAPVLSAHGVGSAEVSYQMEPSGWVLRVTVETLGHGTDGAPAAPVMGSDPIDLGFLAEISRDLSSALDVADIIPNRYQLEVSSPGLERPLRSPRDYERAVGQLAKVRLVEPAPDGQRVLRGRILEAASASVSMDVDGKTVITPLTNVERAHLIFELPAQPKRSHAKPGKQKRH
ncbi:MAG TPA: ribosome maturation factor RimP [Polyangiaceae bacterium]|jgi:ribosome maturation factor RimP|nr:ribosome maturation factor RimP [Polyangiaceae bacterium]